MIDETSMIDDVSIDRIMSTSRHRFNETLIVNEALIR